VEALDRSTESYIGKLLDVRPVHGYGWTENRLQGKAYSHRGIPPPESFRVRLARLWSFQGVDRRGGVGRVETPGHPLNGMWLTFSTRHEGRFNFADRPGYYNVDLSTVEPTEDRMGWPVAPQTAPSEVAYQGWAEIRSEPVGA
jgi:hypothetical protein